MKKNKNKIIGGEFEERVFKTIASGVLCFQKGDIQTKDYVCELKFTEQKGFRITTKILEKLWNQALDSSKLPMLVIGIKNDKYIWKLTCQITKENV